MEILGLGKETLEDTNPHKRKVLTTPSGKLEYSEHEVVISTFSQSDSNVTYFLLLSFITLKILSLNREHVLSLKCLCNSPIVFSKGIH